LVGLVVVALAAAGAGWVLARRHTFAGVVHQPPVAAADFALTDEAGQLFRLSDLRGQWILLSYGYTSCPDVCPVTLANLRMVKSLLGEAASQVRVVFVSVDPERDTTDVLRRYVAHFGEGVKGLTGSPEAVATAAAAYGVRYEKVESDSALGYLVSHTAYVYLIDPELNQRVTFPFGVPASEMAADLQHLIESAK
jgi:protein SCO1/2